MPLEYQMQRRVAFSETDLAGIMHHAKFFHWIEDCEHAFWRSIGLSVLMYDEQGNPYGWPRVAVACEYFAPLQFEDLVDVRIHVVEVGDKSIKFEINFSKDDKAIARGKTTAVCCIHVDGKLTSIPIPPTIREKLEPAGDPGPSD